MSKTTFILITVLFGVICGNRLMDNRLLRSATKSYKIPYKKFGPLNTDLQPKIYEKSSKSLYFPCGSSFDLESDLTAKNCNENLLINLLKQTPNYSLSDDTSDDKINTVNGLKSHQLVSDFDDADGDDVEHVEAAMNSKSMQLEQPKLNMFPAANYKDFYQDLVIETTKQEIAKRNGNSLTSALGSPPLRGCDCKIKNDLLDLGQQHFPRYLLNAVCHSERLHADLGPKCWSGSVCRPLEYKVKVLTFRTLVDNMQKDPTLAWLPDDLRQIWKFKTVTVTAGCFCS